MKIILASKSGVRKNILDKYNIASDVVVSNVDEEQVKNFALQNAPAYQHPRMVVFLDELPLAGPGKVDRSTLAKNAREIWNYE